MGIHDKHDFTDGRMDFEIRRGEETTFVYFKRYQEGDPDPDEVLIWMPTKAFEIFQELVSDPDKVLVEISFFHEVLTPDMRARKWRYLYNYLDGDQVAVHGVATPSGVKVSASAIRDLVKILEARQNESQNGEHLENGENHQGDPFGPKR